MKERIPLLGLACTSGPGTEVSEEDSPATLAGGADNEGDGATSRNSCRAISVESRVESDHSDRYGVE